MKQASSSQLPVNHTIRSLVRVFGLFRRVMDPYFARHGISGSQWGVLVALHRADTENGEPSVRVTDLSERLLIRPPSVTGVVDRLERMGLVARHASDDDQRVKRVRLTPAGRKLVRRVVRNHKTQVETLLAVFDQQERTELQRLLSRLGDHLETLADHPVELNHQAEASVRS